MNSQILVNTDFIKNSQKPTDKKFNQSDQSNFGNHIKTYGCNSLDFKYVISTLSQFFSYQKSGYMAAVKQLYQYQQLNNNFKIMYFIKATKKLFLGMYIPADSNEDKKTQKFTFSYIAILVR